jgi:uncharacterized protein YggT (Ycf19 family)
MLMAIFGLRVLIRAVSLALTAAIFYLAMTWEGPAPSAGCAFLMRVVPPIFNVSLPCVWP